MTGYENPIALNSAAWTTWVSEEIQEGRNRKAKAIGKEWKKKKEIQYQARMSQEASANHSVWAPFGNYLPETVINVFIREGPITT